MNLWIYIYSEIWTIILKKKKTVFCMQVKDQLFTKEYYLIQISDRRGGVEEEGHPDPPPWRFLEIIQKVLVWGFFNVLTFLTNKYMFHSLGSTRGFYTYCLSPQAYCLTYTWVNRYLNLLPVIGFWLFTALWKVLNKKKKMTQFLRRNSA